MYVSPAEYRERIGAPDDRPEFIRVRRVKAARKQHDCHFCHRPIRAGNPYDYVTYKLEGTFNAEHVHSEGGQCIEYAELAKEFGIEAK